MHYHIYRPGPLLSQYVKYYWSLEADAVLPGVKERVFPDGCTELIFHCGDLFRKHDKEIELQPRSFIHGQIKEFIDLEATGHTAIFSVRFYPGGLRAFTDDGLYEITGQHIATGDFWGREGDELTDKILNAGTDQQRIWVVEDFLVKKLKRKKTAADNGVAHCLQLVGRNTAMTVEQMAASVNTGRRNLERRFREATGLSPKQLAGIFRFQYTLKLMQQQQEQHLTEIACKGGFFDQAHFIKDFKRITGMSPGAYCETYLPLVAFFNEE